MTTKIYTVAWRIEVVVGYDCADDERERYENTLALVYIRCIERTEARFERSRRTNPLIVKFAHESHEEKIEIIPLFFRHYALWSTMNWYSGFQPGGRFPKVGRGAILWGSQKKQQT